MDSPWITLRQRRLERGGLLHHVSRLNKKIIRPDGAVGQWKNVPNNKCPPHPPIPPLSGVKWEQVVESGAGAPTAGSGGDSVAFAPGLSPAPMVTFPAPALRTRRADFRHRALQWDHASRTREAVASGNADHTQTAQPAHSVPPRAPPAAEPVTPQQHRTGLPGRSLHLCM